MLKTFLGFELVQLKDQQKKLRKQSLPHVYNYLKVITGLLAALIVLCMPLSAFGIEGLTIVERRVIALFCFAAIMWITEGIPSWGTSVAIIVVLLFITSDNSLSFLIHRDNPLFGSLISSRKIMACFADPIIMLFIGGYSLLNYNVGVFNGSGINRKDDNLTKDIIARLDVHPFLKDLVLSASLIRGTYADAGNPDAANNRYSFGGEYKNDALTIRSEYVRADIETGGEPLTTDGYYLVAGWWLPLESSFRLRPVLRYDRLNSAGTSSVLYMAGLDCWPLCHLRLQAGYTICTEIPSATPHHLFQAMASVKF